MDGLRPQGAGPARWLSVPSAALPVGVPDVVARQSDDLARKTDAVFGAGGYCREHSSPGVFAARHANRLGKADALCDPAATAMDISRRAVIRAPGLLADGVSGA